MEKLEKGLEKDYPKISVPPGNLSLIISKVSFSYPDSEKIFYGQSLQLKKLRSLAVIGENGCGKSTLTALISGMEKPHDGDIEIKIDGHWPSMVYLPQLPERFFGGNTPEEVVNMILSEGLDSDEFIDNITSSLASFQIPWSRISKSPIHLLSLSEARIILIVILSHAKYELLILDEPMFSLGIEQRRKMIEYIGVLLLKKYLIFVTHEEMEATALSELSLVISNGTINTRSTIRTHA